MADVDPGQTPPAEPQVPSVSGVREYLKHHGIEGTDRYQDDASLVADLYRGLHSARNDPRVAQAYQKISEYEKELADPEYVSWKKDRAAKAAPPAPKHKLQEPLPEYQKVWDDLIVYDPQSGQHVVNPRHPHAAAYGADLPMKWRAARDARQARMDDILENFPAHQRDLALHYFKNDADFRKEIVESLREDFRQEFSSSATQRETANFTMNYALDPRNGVLQFDQMGRPLVAGYDQAGQPVWAQTEKGNLLERYAAEYRMVMGYGPKDVLPPEQAERVQRLAVYRLENDMAMGDGLIRLFQQGQGGQPGQPGQAGRQGQPQQPNAQQRNAANKGTWLNEAVDDARANPGENMPSGRQMQRNGKSEKSLVEMCLARDQGLTH